MTYFHNWLWDIENFMLSQNGRGVAVRLFIYYAVWFILLYASLAIICYAFSTPDDKERPALFIFTLAMYSQQVAGHLTDSNSSTGTWNVNPPELNIKSIPEEPQKPKSEGTLLYYMKVWNFPSLLPSAASLLALIVTIYLSAWAKYEFLRTRYSHRYDEVIDQLASEQRKKAGALLSDLTQESLPTPPTIKRPVALIQCAFSRYYDCQRTFDTHAMQNQLSIISKIIKSYDDWHGAAFPALRMPETNLDGVNFDYTDMPYSDLHGASLKRASLNNVDMFKADLNRAVFNWGSLNNIRLQEARCREARFFGASLRAANLGGIDARKAVFTGSDMSHAYAAGASFISANFRHVCLQHADLSEANLRDANMKKTNAESAVFTNCRLDKARLHSTNLTNATLTNVSIKGGILRHAILSRSDLRNSNMPGADFSGAVFNQAIATNARLEDSIWLFGLCTEADFSHTMLNRADFTSADLTQARFNHAELEKVIFNKAKLERTNFYDAKMERAEFKGDNNQPIQLHATALIRAKLNKAVFEHAYIKGILLSADTSLYEATFNSSKFESILWYIDGELLDSLGNDYQSKMTAASYTVLLNDSGQYPVIRDGQETEKSLNDEQRSMLKNSLKTVFKDVVMKTTDMPSELKDALSV
ncbi:hypothetical protein C4J81_12890 [Deltaproteobacteria bacterium Smac51]|nr:hypothetical protein C4J81_12890 [Deltaproteobacteria bacterium Smac51]